MIRKENKVARYKNKIEDGLSHKVRSWKNKFAEEHK
jgi:hypothetical protein